MATVPNSSTAGSDTKPKKLPPEPQFWQKYSAHHEFPLSSVASVMLHVLAFGAIFLILSEAWKQWLGISDPAALPVETIVVGGGGGATDGVGDASGDGLKPRPREAVGKDPEVKTVTPHPSETPVLTPSKPVQTPLTDNSRDPTRFINENDLVLANAKLSQASKDLDKQLTGMLAGKGQGGTGSGGGKGKGAGTGTGDLAGPGTGSLNQRIKRKNRWIMMFSTRSAEDYARQLEDLGAILAVATDNPNEYLVYRDLKRRPVVGQIEDITQMNRISWVDDKPESVQALSMDLGIKPTPRLFVAFFPHELEAELLAKEMAHFRGKEDDIYETYFRVQIQSGRYRPVVQQVVRKGKGS